MDDHTIEQKVFTSGAMDVAHWGVDFHNLLLEDSVRVAAYKKAIFKTVKSGMTVVEVGVGTGILSEWALEAGAKTVYGIEANKEILHIAQDNLKPFGGKFVPILGWSHNVSLPEKVDLLLSEILGNIMDNENCVPILFDAQKRFLKKNGMMIPLNASSCIAPVEALQAHDAISRRDIVSTHSDSPLGRNIAKHSTSELFNLYFDSLISPNNHLSRSFAVSRMSKDNFVEDYERNTQFTIEKSGVFSGFKGWFRAELAAGVFLDTEHVKNNPISWKHAYFPIEVPIPVKKGDILDLTFSRINNTYKWSGSARRGNTVLGRYEHKTINFGRSHVGDEVF